MAKSADALLSMAFKFYETGDFQRALDLLNQNMSEFPDSTQVLSHTKACLYSVMGKTTEALETLRHAIESGIWYPENLLRGDPCLAILQGNSEFERFVAVCSEMRVAAQLAAKPDRLLYPAKAMIPSPLFIALHGNNSNARRSLGHWTMLKESGWHLLLPQSSQASGQPGTFVWNDRDVAIKEIIDHYEKVTNHLQPSGQTVIGGFSRGAGVAIWMALTGLIDVQGFVAVAPSLPLGDVDTLTEVMTGAKTTGIRGYLIIGDEDRDSNIVVNKLEALMSEVGMEYQIEHHVNLGHEFPRSFDGSLSKALDFLNA